MHKLGISHIGKAALSIVDHLHHTVISHKLGIAHICDATLSIAAHFYDAAIVYNLGIAHIFDFILSIIYHLDNTDTVHKLGIVHNPYALHSVANDIIKLFNLSLVLRSLYYSSTLSNAYYGITNVTYTQLVSNNSIKKMIMMLILDIW